MKFDIDRSNTLEVDEFYEMFKKSYLDEILANVEVDYKQFAEKKNTLGSSRKI